MSDNVGGVINNNGLDFYEILEISPNASQDTVDRMFRFLAQRYHPDRTETADTSKFEQIVKAYDTLRDPEKRAAYDIRHKKNSEFHWHLVEEAADINTFEADKVIQARILSVMYTKRKRDMNNPGVGGMQLEQLTGCPQEILDFHLWYLKEKGWIMRMENGLLAITAEGVDRTLSERHAVMEKKLLTKQKEVIHL
jgi:curved DNA-binding protein CbpA